MDVRRPPRSPSPRPTLSDRLRVIVASVVYRGCAIPVARVVMPANKPGKRIDPARVERRRLVMSAAARLTLATVSRAEDAAV